MDYSGNSLLIESLDYLRPPVKRVPVQINNKLKYEGSIKAIEVLEKFRKNISKEVEYPQFKKRGVEPSTSLIFQRSTEREILEQYTVLSYTSLYSSEHSTRAIAHDNDKPILKITGLKSTQTQSPNIKKRKPIVKRVHTSVSNHENPSTKNLYLVLAGHKKDKVYEIKATGSVKLIKKQSLHQARDEDIPLEQISSLKLVLDSLNMDQNVGRDKKKKKRNKKVDIPLDKALEYPKAEHERSFRECFCPNVSRDNNFDMLPPKDCVRITGQLGINEGDRYVLRYAATVNDKPVETRFFQNLGPMESKDEQRLNNFTCNCLKQRYDRNSAKKDFGMQTNFSEEDKFIMQSINNENDVNNYVFTTRRRTQSTQVNVGVDMNFDNFTKLSQPKKEDFDQFPCINAKTQVNEGKLILGNNNKDLKRIQSPVVVISVYPVEDGCENVQVLTKPQLENKGFIPEKSTNFIGNINQCTSRGSRNKEINISRTPRSLSRSPQKINKSKTNIINRKPLRDKKRRTCPGRDLDAKATHQTTNLMRSNQQTSNTNKRDTKPSNVVKKENKSTNTEHVITKKLLVENYTKQLMSFLNNDDADRNIAPPNNSKVAINIDGDREFYNVLLSQGNRTTDLNVRKTLKVRGQQEKNDEYVYNFAQRANRVLKAESTKTQSESNRNSQISPTIKDKFTSLQVRDSIELSQRRRENSESKNNKRVNGTNKNFSGKHYRGDNCVIPDPLRRDQEIRALLGINKGRQSNALVKPIKNIFKRYSGSHDEKCESKIPASKNLLQDQTWPSRVYCNENRIKSSAPPSNENLKKYDCKLNFSERSLFCDSLIRNNNQKYLATGAKLISAEIIPNREELQIEFNLDSKSKSSNDHKIIQCEFHAANAIDSKDTNPSKKSKSTSTTTLSIIGTHNETSVQKASLYQQMILNRNIQVFLQVEQFSKQKPIILSRKQYDKVKRTIENTISNKFAKRQRSICKTNMISVGDVRKKTKHRLEEPLDKNTQTLFTEDNPEIHSSKSSERTGKHKTFVLFPKQCQINGTLDVTPKDVASSVEFQCTSLYMRHIKCSSTNVEVGSIATAFTRDSLSIQTIFKGRRRSRTPNLGTSEYSSECEENFAPKPEIPIHEKQKKPFLRRLMSCLVMRSARMADDTPLNKPPPKMLSESTIDSYHINTSLGAMEMSSSIYDTSASFYTNHSIYPLNTKTKRGFFSSVREFLSSRKS